MSEGRDRPPVPAQVAEWARARAAARKARDWSEADRLRDAIEAAGWTIVDDRTRYSLRPMHPLDLASDGAIRYGRSANVPSVLDQPQLGSLSVVIAASGWPDDVRRAVSSIRAQADRTTQVVVVADGIALDVAEADEVITTSESLGHAAALNCGLRRARAGIVAILDPSVELMGDAVGPLSAALEDPTVAVCGPFGIVSPDLRHFDDGGPGDVDAIEGYLLAFRRADYVARGPFDERFRFYRNFDIWWSLTLRDEGADQPPRRAIAMADLPLVRHEHRGWTSLPEAERDRQSKRNFYRILDRFRDRQDLISVPPQPSGG